MSNKLARLLLGLEYAWSMRTTQYAAVPLAVCLACAHPGRAVQAIPAQPPRVIIVVWDGFRPDAMSADETPTLSLLSQEGVMFADHHSTYPTFTMMNAASLATGCPASAHGFFGNDIFQPGLDGAKTDGTPLHFDREIVFTEDYGTLKSLDRNLGGRLLLVPTLFQAAHARGLRTATVGKSGPAYLQDLQEVGPVIDETHVGPTTLLDKMVADRFAKWPLSSIPRTTDDNTPGDKKTGSQFASASLEATRTRTTMRAYLKYILPLAPDLSVVWMRDPDSTEHAFGPGSPAVHDAIVHQDALLAELLHSLDVRGERATTDIIVMSDHGHSTVSAPPSSPSNCDHPFGPGEVRLAQLLTGAGFKAYDGAPCIYSPTLSPYPLRHDTSGCNDEFNSPSFVLVTPLDASSVVVAPNGGSDYVYVPSHDPALVRRVVAFLGTRREIAAIFAEPLGGSLPPGALPLAAVSAEDSAGRHPDIIVAYSTDQTSSVLSARGLEYASMFPPALRGMHGSLGHSDLHALLVAAGPHFKKRVIDHLPSSNTDIAPTVAALLGIPLPTACGRVLEEALSGTGVDESAFSVDVSLTWPAGPVGMSSDPSGSSHLGLRRKVLRRGATSTTYVDGLEARQSQ